MNSNRLAQSNPNLKAFGQSYYTSLIALPCLIALVRSAEEPIAISSNPLTCSLWFVLVLVVFSLIANANNYLLLACTSYVSPMATTVSGQIKDFASLLCGFVFFNDVQPNLWFIAGLSLSMLSAVYYTLAKTRQPEPRRQVHSDKFEV